MEFGRDFVETLERVESLLAGLGLPHFFTGGLVAVFYGEPRLTQDADVVLKMRGDEAERLVETLEPKYHLDRDDILEAVHEGRMFQAIDRETMVKIDFHLGEAVPGEFERSRRVHLFSGEIDYPIVSKEDAILSKLLWIEKGSHKSRADVVGMLLAPEPLDLEFVRSMAEELAVASLFDELWREARG